MSDPSGPYKISNFISNKISLRLIMRAKLCDLSLSKTYWYPGTKPSSLVHSHHFQYPPMREISINV